MALVQTAGAQSNVLIKDGTGNQLENNVNAAQTAADSNTVHDGELRQSFGNLADSKPVVGQDLGADFTVAEDLHRRTATPKGPEPNVRTNPQLISQVFGSPSDSRARLHSAEKHGIMGHGTLQQNSQPFMKRRLMSRKRVKSRSGARSAARIFSGNNTQPMVPRNQAPLYEGQTLNIQSNVQMPGSQADVRKNLASAGPGHQRNGSLTDSFLQGGATVDENQATIEDGALKTQKFDPSKYISEDFLQILNEHRKNCEREGKLEQATLARKRLKELRIFEEQKRKEETYSRHREEMESLETAHRAEIKELQNKWNNIILPQNENEAALIEMELKKKHQKELDDFRISIENGSVQCPRLHYSAAVIEMQKRQDYLGQAGFYKDAKILKKQIKAAQQIERERFNMESRQKLFKKSEDLIKRHKKEMTAVQTKHQSQRQSLLNARRKEFEVIELRFVNVWNEMASRFKKELNDMEKHSAVKKMTLKAKNRMPVSVVL